MFDSIAIVGATGAVGTHHSATAWKNASFPYQRIKFLASGRSAGKQNQVPRPASTRWKS